MCRQQTDALKAIKECMSEYTETKDITPLAEQ